MLSKILANSGKSFWMPQRASTVAGDVDGLFSLVLWISVFFTVLIATLVIFFAIKYRARHKGAELEGKTAGHSTALELTWTIIPTVLVLVIFYDGFRTYLNMSVAPTNAYEIQVTGRMWGWQFTYPNGHVDDKLVVPADTPVLLVQTSVDVIHSLYIPAFRVKKDVVPGRYTRQWFRATELGSFDVYCAEYCGTRHSKMVTTVEVKQADDFRAWLEEAGKWEGKISPAEAGKMFYQKRNCNQCHSLDGTPGIGPSWKNVFGYERPLANGQTVIADENYIAESIKYPGNKVVAGFGNVMPTYLGSLKDPDIGAIIAFMKSISDRGGSTETPGATQPATGPATRLATQPAGAGQAR